MKQKKRLMILFALALCVCTVLSSCSLLKTETAQTTGQATAQTTGTATGKQTVQTTENGGQAEMTTITTTAAPHEHEFGAWTTARTPSCTVSGLERRVCSCGKTEQRRIARLGHTKPDENGKCTRCGDLIYYEYPMEQATILDGTIVTATNKYQIMKNYRGAVIELADIPFDTVTVTRLAAVSEMGYAFLTELPLANQVAPFASGYTKVIWDENETATLGIPSDAKYLYVYYLDAGVIYLPSSVAFFNTETPPSFTIATWNIGHFSMGGRKNSVITDTAYATEKPKYLSYLNGEIGADVIALSEYSALFTPSHSAAELFSDYTGTAFVGEQRNSSCNALYSKLPLKNVAAREFACNTPETVLHTNVIKATDYYYVVSELTVGGETVTIVALHLAFHDNLYPDTVCTNQMDELIDLFADKECVIMLGDWNAYRAEYYDRFTRAGYTVGNDGSCLTCTGSRTGGLEWPVDNIIVKGVTMTDFHTVNTSLSDHVAVMATITLE